MRSRNLVIAAAAAVVIAVGAGIWWFTSGDEPDEVDLDVAAESARDRSTTSTTPTDDGTVEAQPGGEPGDISGSWTVDTETGEFDFESATGSFVGFRVEEQLVGFGAATAVGRTGEVTGTLTIDGTSVSEASFTADLASLTTNESRRDRRVHEALDTSQHPDATFVLGSPIELPSGAADGEQISVEATGELTVNGVTNPITVSIDAQLVDGTVVVVGSTEVTFSDYGVEVPSAPVVVSADDHGVLEFQLLFVRS